MDPLSFSPYAMLESFIQYEDNKTYIKNELLVMTGTVGTTKVLGSHVCKVSLVFGRLSWFVSLPCYISTRPTAEFDNDCREPYVDSWTLYTPNPSKLLSESLSQRLGEERKLLLFKSLRSSCISFNARLPNAAAIVNIINGSILSIQIASACILLLQLICVPNALVPFSSTNSRANTG